MKPSSSGWRSASSAGRWNSASSSRSRTPRCARLASPGLRCGPPPTIAAVEALWCGARNGGCETSGCSRSTSPATEWIRVTSSASAESSAGRIPGSRRASIVFPVPGGPPKRTLCPPAAASSSARRARSCPRTSARSGAAGAGVAVGRERRLRLQLELPAKIRDCLGEMPNRHRCDTRERGLPRGIRRAEETLDAEPARSLGDREHAADPAQPAVERELADRRRALERASRQLLRRGEQRERDGQIEAGALLAQLGRREVHGDSPLREVQLRGCDPRADALPRLLARPVGEADDREARKPVANVRLDVDPPRLETDERMRDRACKHPVEARSEAVHAVCRLPRESDAAWLGCDGWPATSVSRTCDTRARRAVEIPPGHRFAATSLAEPSDPSRPAWASTSSSRATPPGRTTSRRPRRSG